MDQEESLAERRTTAFNLLPDPESLSRSEIIQATAAGRLPEDEVPDTDAAGPRVGTAGLEGLEAARPGQRPPRELSNEVRQERRRYIEAGKRAIAKRRGGRDPQLTREEELGLEAIILLASRPALLVQGGTFAEPSDERSILVRPDVRSAIERTVQSVGRIEVTSGLS